MSTELTIKNDFAAQLAEFDKIQETCRKLLQTKHYQQLGEAGIHGIMARAKALGVHPFEALNGGFICINGKIGLSTEMMAALVRRRGHSITKDPKSTPECVILHGKRADNGDVWTCTFTRQDAEIAGLWNTATWKKYPAVMLYNRCMSMLFRQLFPDLSLGAGYIEDELKEITRTGEYSKPIDVEVEQVNEKEDVKPLYIEEKPKAAVKITPDQVKELENILFECEEEFRLNVFQYLKTLTGSEDLKDFPAKNYEKTKEKALKNRAEFFQKQKSEYEQKQMEVANA